MSKWWVIPNFDMFGSCGEPLFQNYSVEEEKDFYSRNRPPLKTGFDSEDEAKKWLFNYLNEERLFVSARNEIANLGCNLGIIEAKLHDHKKITQEDWDNCFASFKFSMECGVLKDVTQKSEKGTDSL